MSTNEVKLCSALVLVLLGSVHPSDLRAEPVLLERIEQQQRQLDLQREQIERQQKLLDEMKASMPAPPPAPSAQRDAAPAALVPPPPPAAGSSPNAAPPAHASTELPAATDGRPQLRIGGYGELSYQRYDFYANPQSATAQRRAKTDLRRFVLAPRADFGGGWSFFAELEIEHGGTGATIEYERDEAGEFESEIEKGGEVALEALFLQYEHSPALRVRMGELVVPVGMINLQHNPTRTFTIERSLAETALIPSTWHETGLELRGDAGPFSWRLLAVTALDSTGFSGYGFVSQGMQRKMEFRNASSLAYIAHANWRALPGLDIGGSFYTGDSAGNRPRKDMEESARVTLAEIHARYERGPWTVRSQYLQGWVQNSAAIVRANATTYNGRLLGVSRTPVGSKANSFFAEVGYDVMPLMLGNTDQRLDLFARHDRYDTHQATDAGIARNSAYRHTAWTVGVNWHPQRRVVVKAEYSKRRHYGQIRQDESIAGLGVGFSFF